MQRRFLLMSVWVVLVACGGSSSPPPASEPTQPAASAGAEAPVEEASSEPEQPVAAASPATLKVVTKVGGKALPARIKVFDESGALLAEGASDKPLAVRSGELSIEVALPDSKELRGGETVQRSVSVAPGADVTETVIIERCMVRVNVRIRGKLDPTSVVTLLRDGATIAKLTSGDQDYVAVAPGRYNVKVRSKRAEIVSSDITLNEGATQTIPIDVD
jgi:hypothetical protein